jgi:AcrR family transcriptional regulator
MPKQTFFNLSEERKKEIMDAICRELSRHTYEHINLSNIVRETNMSRGSLYQYFDDKDDLYNYFYMEIARQKMTYFGSLMDPLLDISFFERIEKMYMLALKFIKEHPEWVLPARNLLLSNNYRNSAVAKEGKKLAIGIYHSWIDADIKKGYIKANLDTKLLAKLFYEMLNQVSTDDFIFDRLDDESILNQVQELIHIFKKGIENDV